MNIFEDLDCEYYEQHATVQIYSQNLLFNKIKDDKIKNALEIGSGTGFLANKISEYNKNITIDCFDISRKMINFASQKYPKENINLILKNRNWIEFEDFKNFQKYDLIYSNFTFQWIENFESFLKKMTKYGKKIIFTTLLDETFINIVKRDDLFINLYKKEEIIKTIDSIKNIKYNIEFFNFKEEYDDIFAVLNHFKKIGATYRKKTNISNLIHLRKQKKKKIEINNFFCLIEVWR